MAVHVAEALLSMHKVGAPATVHASVRASSAASHDLKVRTCHNRETQGCPQIRDIYSPKISYDFDMMLQAP